MTGGTIKYKTGMALCATWYLWLSGLIWFLKPPSICIVALLTATTGRITVGVACRKNPRNAQYPQARSSWAALCRTSAVSETSWKPQSLTKKLTERENDKQHIISSDGSEKGANLTGGVFIKVHRQMLRYSRTSFEQKQVTCRTVS